MCMYKRRKQENCSKSKITTEFKAVNRLSLFMSRYLCSALQRMPHTESIFYLTQNRRTKQEQNQVRLSYALQGGGRPKVNAQNAQNKSYDLPAGNLMEFTEASRGRIIKLTQT